MNLSQYFTRYIEGRKEGYTEKSPVRLFATDVGKCPRMVAYRLLQTPKDPDTQGAIDNRTIMFSIADYLESTLIDALNEEGDLIFQQGGIPFPDRDNWGGRYDILANYNGRRIIEVKSLRSNAFTYELPKQPHVYQACLYHHYLKDDEKLEAPPVLWYVDRGGANSPQEFVLNNWRDEMEQADYLMDELDNVRDNLPNLPPKMPRELKLRSYGKSVKEEGHYACQYCDYKETCQPDMSKREWATLRDDGVWELKKAADPAKLRVFGIKRTERW